MGWGEWYSPQLFINILNFKIIPMKNTKLRLFLLTITLLGFSACGTMDQMNQDISTLQSDVASLKKETQSLQDLRKEVADLSVQVDETQNNLQEVRGRVDDNQHAVDKSLKEIKTHIGSLDKNTSIGVSSSPPPTSGVTPLSTPSPAALDAEVVYNDAYKIFQEGRYPESRSAFVKFLQQFPQTEYSDNAQFWIGEAYFKEGKTEEAILAFEDVVKKYPQGNKVADALVRQGLCFKILGDKDNARIILQRVIDKYPNSPQSDMARKELEGLS
jgi:tol-pal system protein YbgF